jgi:hypothetical protein
MASNPPDPATLRALADKLESAYQAVFHPSAIAAVAALRACADAQERPATRVASMVGLSENIIVLPSEEPSHE